MARTRLFKRLPEAWKRYDADRVAERYLGVLDGGLDRSHDLAREVLGFRSVDEVPDRFLPLAGELVGHEWRSDKDHDWNRSRIRDAIRRYSYKGTIAALSDLIKEHGGSWWDVTDMASRLWVWNRQGRFNRDDSHVLAADFWHPGAFLLHVLDDLDFEGFLKDFEKVRKGGEVWYFNHIWRLPNVVQEQTWDATYEVEQDASRVQFGRYNRDLFNTFKGAAKCELEEQPAPMLDGSRRVFGRFNIDLFMTFRGALKGLYEFEDTYPATPHGSLVTMDSTIRCDRTDITVDQGVPGNPLTLEAALLQEPACIIEETI
jgi:hypothetical protein